METKMDSNGKCHLHSKQAAAQHRLVAALDNPSHPCAIWNRAPKPGQ